MKKKLGVPAAAHRSGFSGFRHSVPFLRNCPFRAAPTIPNAFLCLTNVNKYNYNIIMEELIFEWDPVKADLNYTKHKVTFEEAKSVFYDENAILIADPDHSSMDEDRFVILGLSSELHMLVVCHCYRENDRIRIISARKANTLETAQYGGN